MLSSAPSSKGNPSLNRRRGTAQSRGRGGGFASYNFRDTMLILLCVAVCLTVFLIILVSLNTTPIEQQQHEATAGHKVVSIPNMLRAHNVQEVKDNIKQDANLVKAKIGQVAHNAWDKADHLIHHGKQHKQQPGSSSSGQQLSGGDSSFAPPGPQGLGGKELDLHLYAIPPTRQYPYNLDPVPDNYDIRAQYAPSGGKRFTEYTTGGSPYLPVSDTIRQLSDAQARTRRAHVKAAMQHAWTGYSTYAFGQDEVKPQSKTGSANWGGQGITLVDALDTLWLMDMKDEFYHARDWVRDNLHHDQVGSVSVFETTIRDLGGLLAAYDWSQDKVFLDKATDLAERLLHAFDGSSTGIPYGMVNMKTGSTTYIGWSNGNAILAEFGTIQLENRYLSKMTGRPEFAQKTENVFKVLHEISPANGLFPYYMKNNPRDGSSHPTFANSKLTFGAMADSFYEYMLKIWLQGGKTEPMYREMYDKAMDGMHKELLQTSTPSGLVYIADKNGPNGPLDHKMDHLVCFMGGLLALGAYTDPQGLDSERAQRDLRTAKAVTYTCYQMYARMNTGISPEYIQFSKGNDFQIGRGAPHYLLRPEAVESFFILNQLTGDPIYREWGWEVFQSIEKYCKTSIAYGALSNVQQTTQQPRDSMESFFLAETLKYLYLLFDPDTEIDLLNKHVFNTEAHPTRIFSAM